jgi:hypothetical protein
MIPPFRFYSQLTLVELLGRRARTAAELLEGIRAVPDMSIYFHTHRFLRQHIRLSPEPPNDFAFWASNALGLERLGEALASVNVVKVKSLRELRDRLLAVLQMFLREENGRRPESPEGLEFHFLCCRLFIFPTSYEARSLADFVACLPHLPPESLLYHVFAPRLARGRPSDDFSAWLAAAGHPDLARVISRLDPYTMTIEGLRLKIIELVNAHAHA